MKNYLSKIQIALLGLYCAGFSGLNMAFAAETPCPTTDPTCVSTASTPNSLAPADLLGSVINWVLGFAGAVAVLFLIYGGILYVTSSGNDKQIETAKKILTFAVIGLIIIILAEVIVVFVKASTQGVLDTTSTLK